MGGILTFSDGTTRYRIAVAADDPAEDVRLFRRLLRAVAQRPGGRLRLLVRDFGDASRPQWKIVGYASPSPWPRRPEEQPEAAQQADQAGRRRKKGKPPQASVRDAEEAERKAREHMQRGDLAGAEREGNHAMRIRDELGLAGMQWIAYELLGGYFRSRGNPDEAELYYMTAKEMQDEYHTRSRQVFDRWPDLVAQLVRQYGFDRPDHDLLFRTLDEIGDLEITREVVLEEDWRVIVAAIRRVLGGDRGSGILPLINPDVSRYVHAVLDIARTYPSPSR